MKRLKIYSEKGWVNITGMVGQHKSEWWVNMVWNLHSDNNSTQNANNSNDNSISSPISKEITNFFKDQGDTARPNSGSGSTRAGNIFKNTLKLIGTTVIVGGGPEDPYSDVIAGGEFLIGTTSAGVIYLYDEYNDPDYKAKWKTTFRPWFEDPIHHPMGTNNDGYPPNLKGPLGWFVAGVAIYEVIKNFQDKMDELFPPVPVHNPNGGANYHSK